MADAASLQEAVGKLEVRGAKRIGVVRLFVSGESWYERTRQSLGLGAPHVPRPLTISMNIMLTTVVIEWSFGRSKPPPPSC